MLLRFQTHVILLVLILFVSFLFLGCSNNSTSVCEISGTITYLNSFGIDLAGETCNIVVDSDDLGMGDNGNEVATYSFTWLSGTTQDYVIDISTLPPGKYYLRVYMEFIVGAATWRIYGWYGGDIDHEGHDPRHLAEIECNSSFDFIIEAT